MSRTTNLQTKSAIYRDIYLVSAKTSSSSHPVSQASYTRLIHLICKHLLSTGPCSFTPLHISLAFQNSTVVGVSRSEPACCWARIPLIHACGLRRYFALSSQRLGSLRTSSRASSPTSPPSTASMTSSCCLSSKHASLENGEKGTLKARMGGSEVFSSGPAGRCQRCREIACVSRKWTSYVLVFMPTSASFTDNDPSRELYSH